jgi:hypothetical protein
MSKDCDTRGGRGEVLDRMAAQNGSDRINLSVIELEQLRESI